MTTDLDRTLAAKYGEDGTLTYPRTERSLSVGDLVKVSGHGTHVVDHFGFRPVEEGDSYHGDPVTAFPGDSCDGCLAEFAADFLVRTAAQKDRFMVPAPADYLACDRTINEERERLRWEYRSHGVREALIEATVDRVCPRAWLDRRLREVL